MVKENERFCPVCGGILKHYDRVKRIIRVQGGASRHMFVRRLRCSKCGVLHRELPDSLLPYKQYSSDTKAVKGVVISAAVGVGLAAANKYLLKGRIKLDSQQVIDFAKKAKNYLGYIY